MTKIAAMRSGTLPTDSGPQASSTSDMVRGESRRRRGGGGKGRCGVGRLEARGRGGGAAAAGGRLTSATTK